MGAIAAALPRLEALGLNPLDRRFRICPGVVGRCGQWASSSLGLDLYLWVTYRSKSTASVRELDALRFAPGEKAPHGAGIGAAGVGIGDLGREELVGGKAGGLSGSLQDGAEGLRQGAGAGNQHVHIIGRFGGIHLTGVRRDPHQCSAADRHGRFAPGRSRLVGCPRRLGGSGGSFLGRRLAMRSWKRIGSWATASSSPR